MGEQYQPNNQEVNDISVLEPDATYSYADYLRWTFEERVELIKGKVFRMSPAPVRKHQKVSINLSLEIGNFLKGQNCEVYAAPFDVRLPQDKNDPDNQIFTVVQPDICVICDPEKLDDAGCKGAPDLIIEILSPSTASKDLKNKYELYEGYKVKEYWVVYPMEHIVEIFTLDQQNKYGSGRKYTADDEIKTEVLPGLVIRLEDVFA